MVTHTRWFMVAALAVATVPGCQRDEQAAATTVVQVDGEPTPVTPVTALKASPSTFYGKEVRLAGEVVRVFDDRVFVLDGAGWALDDNIAVMTATPVQVSGTSLGHKDEVIVTGKIEPFVIANVEKMLGWELSPELAARVRDRPVMIADSVRKVHEIGGWARGSAVRPIASVAALFVTRNLDALVDLPVDIAHERVLATTGKGVWIGPNTMSQVFVLPGSMPTDVKTGDTVHVSGTLHKAPATAATDWGLASEEAALARTGVLFVDKATVQKEPTSPGV